MYKSCPSCSRVYRDVTMNYCLEDGELLSEFVEKADGAAPLSEILTQVRSSSVQSKVPPGGGWTASDERRRFLDEWRYEKTPRASSVHPEIDSAVTSDRPRVQMDILRFHPGGHAANRRETYISRPREPGDIEGAFERVDPRPGEEV